MKNEIPAIREATGAFCRSLLDALLPSIRIAAREKGYAVAVHGSLKRDIDLIAVAWTDQAKSADDVAEAIRGAICGVIGRCNFLTKDGERSSAKPHGRKAYTLIHMGHAGEIDLSVMPPAQSCHGSETA